MRLLETCADTGALTAVALRKPVPEPFGAALTVSGGVTMLRRAPAILPPVPMSMVALT